MTNDQNFSALVQLVGGMLRRELARQKAFPADLLADDDKIAATSEPVALRPILAATSEFNSLAIGLGLSTV